MRDLFFIFHYTVMGILGTAFFIVGFLVAMACYPIYYIKKRWAVESKGMEYPKGYFIW